MPQIGVFLAGLFGETIAVTSAAASIIGAVVTSAATFVVGQVFKAFSKKPPASSLSTEMAARQVTVRQAAAPRRVVYGFVGRVGGVITYLSVAGPNNEFLDLVITLTGHEVDSITAMYLDGVAVTLNGSGDAISAPYAGLVHAEFNLGTRDQAAFAGLIANSGGLWTSDHRQRGCASVYLRLKYDTTAFPNGMPNPTFDINGKKVYDPRTGTIAFSSNCALCEADYLFNMTYGLGAQSKVGLVSSMVTASGMGSFSAVNSVDGDPTDVAWDTDSATSGAFVHLDLGTPYEFRRFRIYMSASGYLGTYDIEYSDDDSTWFLAGFSFLPDVVEWNEVELAPNGTHRYWRIKLTNTPGSGPNIREFDFWTSDVDTTALAAAANTCDEAVPLLAGGTEPRYTCNGTFTTDALPKDVIPQLNSAHGGSALYTAGKWAILPAAWPGVTLNLGDGDLRGPISVQTRVPHAELFNGVKGTFASPTNNWQMSDFPPYQDPGYLLEDDNEQLWLDVQYPFTTSAATCQRLSKIALQKKRRQISILEAPFKLQAWQVQPGDVVQLTHDRFGWTNKQFEVLTCKLVYATEAGSSEGGQMGDGPEPQIVGVSLSLHEIDSTAYDWSTADEDALNTPPTSIMPAPGTVGAPTGLTLTNIEVARVADGVKVCGVRLDWTAPADQAVRNGGQIRIQHKKHTDTTWIDDGALDGSATEFDVIPLIDGTQYDFQIWAENIDGAKSAIVSGTKIPSATAVTVDTIADGSSHFRPPIGVTLPTDLPYNGGFEIWPDTQSAADGWTPEYVLTGGAYSRSNTPFNGNYAQALTSNGGGSASVASRPFGVKPGLQYDVRVRVKAVVNNTGKLWLSVYFFSDDNDLSAAARITGSVDVVAGHNSNANSWVLWEGQVTAPANAKFARIVLANDASGTFGTLLFDTAGWALFQISDPQNGVASGPIAFEAGSGAFVDLDDMTFSLPTFGGKVLVLFHSDSFQSDFGTTITIQVLRDGIVTGPSPFSNGWPLGVTWIWIDNPGPGSHVYKVQWKTSGADGLVEDGSRNLNAVEFA